jgi:hypothetical protein
VAVDQVPELNTAWVVEGFVLSRVDLRRLERITASMTRTLTYVAALLAILGFGVFFGPLRPAKTRAYHLYICTGCGLQKSVEESKLGPVTYSRGTAFHDTRVSNVLATNGCGHSWFLYDSGTSGGSNSATSGLPAKKRTLAHVYILLDDTTFPSELTRMNDPRGTWRLLVTALETNQALNASLLEWSRALPYRSFGSWWRQSSLGKTNGP